MKIIHKHQFFHNGMEFSLASSTFHLKWMKPHHPFIHFSSLWFMMNDNPLFTSTFFSQNGCSVNFLGKFPTPSKTVAVDSHNPKILTSGVWHQYRKKSLSRFMCYEICSQLHSKNPKATAAIGTLKKNSIQFIAS